MYVKISPHQLALTVDMYHLDPVLWKMCVCACVCVLYPTIPQTHTNTHFSLPFLCQNMYSHTHTHTHTPSIRYQALIFSKAFTHPQEHRGASWRRLHCVCLTEACVLLFFLSAENPTGCVRFWGVKYEQLKNLLTQKSFLSKEMAGGKA